ncbi:MAG: V-type ATP synthase subunit F [Thermofilaceae archaeon]
MVVGELSFLEGFKLAGVRRLVEVESLENVKQKLAEILVGLYRDPSVGVIVIQQRFRDLIIDKVERVGREQLVVFIPGLKEVPQIDVKDYYSRMVKSYLGVIVEV